jgi:hypothetical protein
MTPRPVESEKDLDGLLFGSKGAAAQCGWTFRYHVLRSKGSQAGFPDRVLVRERVVFVETKGPKTRVTPEQVGWLTALAKAGAECYLWRPSDLTEAVEVLARRWFLEADGYLYTRNRDCRLAPRSLWLPEGCRADQREARAA